MNELERKQVLEMLASGKITAAEASEILNGMQQPAQPAGDLKAAEAVHQEKLPGRGVDDEIVVLDETAAWKKTEPAYASETMPGNGERPRWLKIRVRDMSTGRNKVTVNLPLRLVTFGLGIANRFGADLNGVEVGEIIDMIQQGEKGILVDVEDEEDGEHVQVILD
jgi:hypothetical protein